MSAVPEIWADEQQAARLCGHSYQWFVRHRAKLESQGFPPRHPVIRKRPVSVILSFLGLAESSIRLTDPPDPPNTGDWG